MLQSLRKNNIPDKSFGYTRAPGAYKNKVVPDIDYFTNEPLVQCDVPVVTEYFCRLLHINDTNDK